MEPLLKHLSKLFAFGVAFSLALFAQAQHSPFPQLTPQPYVFKPHYDARVDDSIKTVFVIRKLDQDRGKQDDTTSKYEYDRQGRQIKSIRYDKNKLSSVTSSEYLDGLPIHSVFTQGNTKSYYIYSYNSNGDLTSSREYTLNGVDTVLRTSQAYSYDEQNRLIVYQRYTNTFNNEKIVFQYLDNLVVREDFINQDTISFKRNLYFLNPDKTLAKNFTIQFSSDNPDTVFKAYYRYENDLLMYEKRMSHYIDTTEAYFSYDTNNHLVYLKFKCDGVYNEIRYNYSHDTLKSKEIIKQTEKNFLGYYTALSISEIMKPPVHILETFQYDKKGHLVEKTISYNGKVKFITQFVIEYYSPN